MSNGQVINTLPVSITAGVGVVYFNGAALLPHDVQALSIALRDAANAAITCAARQLDAMSRQSRHQVENL